MKKKILFIIVILVVIGAAVLYITNEKNENIMKQAMSEYASDYFQSYMSAGTGANAYKVTLKTLKEANENGEDYDLSTLSKCDEEKTYANVQVDYKTGNAKNAIVELCCKKW